MCGICGVVGQYRPEWVDRMLRLMVHRGPDDGGAYWDRQNLVGMGMRRLAILDLAGGRQPMANEDGTLHIVYNGEVYNSPDLQPPLIQAGHVFRSDHSDTEVVLHLFEDLGVRALDRLNGMFAFAIYDRRKGKVFLARDRVGIKPLYYWAGDGLFAWASELKCLLTIPGVERRVDPQSLFHYMSLLYVPGERTIIEGVRRLPPGHWLEYDVKTRTLQTHRYWDLQFRPQRGLSEEEWAQRLRHALAKSVRMQMLSDVPVGCSLSGGLDSSSIVSLLGEMGVPRIRTYSLGFAGPGEESWDELPLAREVARKWGTEHHEYVLDPQSLLDDLVKMVWHLDEPYAGGLPSWYVFRQMRQDVTVGLTGTGGDELFGNYGKFTTFEQLPLARLAQAYRRSPALLRRLFWNPALAMLRHVPDGLVRASRKSRALGLPQLAQEPMRWFYLHVWYYFDDPTKAQSVLRHSSGFPNTGSLLQAAHDESGARSYRDAIAYVDFQTQLPEEFLFFTDRLSMAHSLEVRVPFLDHEFVELAMQIPPEIRTRATDFKYLLKRAMGPLLPPALLKAPKRGFVIPITLWLRKQLRPLAERLLAPERLEKQGYMRGEFYHRYVQPHFEGKDYTWQVWAALMFQLWHVVFVEQPSDYEPTITWRDLL